ncbi:hypothetical protein [Fusobacterium sp.]|uniref:hypothetical protein n=1 Tax=Fusobacterium sp. TaxID=68766 RepID=UPI000E7EF5A1|nr:hypothetical protein [Fusobacterium sp.]HBJ80183.1 hypothetical protein [Fusobacterium sp.]
MLMACGYFIEGDRGSKVSPFFKKIQEANKKIERNLRYLKVDSMTGYFEIRFLPLGEGLGYDNHPFHIIEELELIKNCLNEAVSLKKSKEKNNGNKRK